MVQPCAQGYRPGSGAGQPDDRVWLALVSSMRASIEKASLPLLKRLSTLPRLVPFILVLALLVAGMLIDGWGFVLTLVVALFLGWMLFLGWPRLATPERLMRLAIIVLAIGIAATQAFPRT
jgi:hypothetical protein